MELSLLLLFLESLFGLVKFMKAQAHPVHIQQIVDILPSQTALLTPSGTGSGAGAPQNTSDSIQQHSGKRGRGWWLLDVFRHF